MRNRNAAQRRLHAAGVARRIARFDQPLRHAAAAVNQHQLAVRLDHLRRPTARRIGDRRPRTEQRERRHDGSEKREYRKEKRGDNGFAPPIPLPSFVFSLFFILFSRLKACASGGRRARSGGRRRAAPTYPPRSWGSWASPPPAPRRRARSRTSSSPLRPRRGA